MDQDNGHSIQLGISLFVSLIVVHGIYRYAEGKRRGSNHGNFRGNEQSMDIGIG
jgi:hypothetical protein